MSSLEGSAEQKCRGVIVVDSSDFITLSAKYERSEIGKNSALAELSKPTGCYLDLLTVLASHGYRILIPELVSLQSGHITATGKNIDQYFLGHRQDFASRGISKQFLCNVASGYYPGIEIIPAKEGIPAKEEKPYRSYMDSIRKALKISIPDKSHQNQNIAMALINLDRSYSDDKKNFSAAHCLDVIKDEIICQNAKEKPTPIFLLSFNNQLRSDLREHINTLDSNGRKHPPINVITSGGLLLALQNSVGSVNANSAFAEMGLSGDIITHWRNILSQLSGNHSLPEHPLGKEKSDDTYYDSPIEEYGTGRFPFAESMAGMADELAAERMSLESMVGDTGQVKKFWAKYGAANGAAGGRSSAK